MPDEINHPPKYIQCNCSRLCNGGKWVHERTYLRHKPHRAEDVAREREQNYAKVTASASLHTGTRAGNASSSRHLRAVKKPANTRHRVDTPTSTSPLHQTNPDPDAGMEDDAGNLFPHPSTHRTTPEPGERPDDAPIHEEDIHSRHSPHATSTLNPLDLEAWNEEGEWHNGQDGTDEQGEEIDEEDEEEEEVRADITTSDPLPQATLATLALSQQLIASIKNAELEDDIQDPRLLHSIRHPSTENEPLDVITSLSIEIFDALVGGSEKMYNDVRMALGRHNCGLIHSYDVIKKKIEKITGITQIQTDMCPNSCIAYTGPFKALETCPKCEVSRYEDPPTPDDEPSSRPRRKGEARKPRKQFYTIPLGPQLQALWRTPDGADRMRYRNRKNQDIAATLHANGYQLPALDDVFHGLEYLNAVRAGQVADDDILLMYSIDGAQLYRDKDSDCFFSIWVILNLGPDLRYKKKYVLPANFIPGPKKPANTESFLLPSFRHASALQKEGLKVYDARKKEEIVSRLFFCFFTADTVAIPTLNGLVGHTGGSGCRIPCGQRGRRKPKQPTYYPAALKPINYSVKGCDHPDIDLNQIGGPDAARYHHNLRIVLQSKTKREFTKNRLLTGIARPSICLGFDQTRMFRVPHCFSLDIMHLLNLNLTHLLISIWRNGPDIKLKFDSATKPDFIIFDDENIWQAHGNLIASISPYLPSSFDHPPRNPAKKISSGYKACEFMLYFWALGPAVFRPFLPHHLWVHFCKLVCGLRAILQRHITQAHIIMAQTMLNEWVKEFEEKYYNRQISRLHLVRPCVHAVVHAARETVRCGPLNLVAQWVLENAIGNLGREVHQHSNPFSNLSQRGLLRAQMNALKAIYPQFDHSASLPRGAQDLGSGYTLLYARDRNVLDISDEQEKRIFTAFLLACGKPQQKLSLIRWARLRLPNGQIARCAWKELQNKNTRNSRNIKIVSGDNIDYAEVLYFFQFAASNDNRAFALVSLYTKPDEELLRESFGTLWVARYLGRQALGIVRAETIHSVVGMVPFILSDAETANAQIRAKFESTFFVSEKPFLDCLGAGDVAEEQDSVGESSNDFI